MTKDIQATTGAAVLTCLNIKQKHVITKHTQQ